MSVQDAVTIALPELWLHKTSPCVVFANSNLPKKRYKIFHSKEEIVNMPANSKDLFKRNMLDQYVDPTKNFGRENIKYLMKCAMQNSFQIIH